MSESEIQRILDRLDELKDDLHKQHLDWSRALSKMQLKCAGREETFMRMKAYMDAHPDTHEEWVEKTLGKRVLLVVSGVIGAIVYIMAQQIIKGIWP